LARVVAGFPLISAKAGIQRRVPAFAGASGQRRAFGFALLSLALTALAGCGRNGPLELPPGPATNVPSASTQLTTPDGRPAPGSPQDAAMKTGFDEQGHPVATAGEKKTFILDPLLQ
jgi:predicted small lipoprotein YifL